MSLTQEDLIKLIHDTKAVSIWNRETGPLFWYIAGVPGPYYVNTELLIGKNRAKELLDYITSILKENCSLEERSNKISEAVLREYENNNILKNLVFSLIEKTKEEFRTEGFNSISGGERRDWLFSIPFAKEMGLEHLFLFKDLSIFCSCGTRGKKTLHIADLINNAASYINIWLPALKNGGASCVGSLCVISRGNSGIEKMSSLGLRVTSLCSIDLNFFERSFKTGLIDKETFEEIALHFESPKKWAERYVMGKKFLFFQETMDSKTEERRKQFFEKDPWSLRKDYMNLFEEFLKKYNDGN